MKKAILKIIAAVAAIIGISLPAKAFDIEVDGIYYNISSDSTACVTYRNYINGDYTDDIVIPEQVTYNGKIYNVTEIGFVAFAYSTGLTSVTIPNSVTTIGVSAFEGCSKLNSVTIPNSVTAIGSNAFFNTGYWNNCPESLVYIDDCLVGYKGSISGAIVIKDQTRLISERAFQNCSGLTSVTIPNSVTVIGVSAFYGCNGLTSVTIGNSVTEIGSSAFEGCSGLTSVTIPNSVTAIGRSAFSNCSGLTSVTIPNSVTEIGSYAFRGCSGLTSVTIPNSVTAIGRYAFSGCNGLTSVTIGNSVTEIGSSAFEGCSGLTSVTIPNSVTAIGSSAFSNCSGLTSVTIPNSVTEIGDHVFYGCSGLTSVTIPNSVTEIGSSAFEGCSGLTSVTIPNSVTTIGDSAFRDCSGLKEVYIEDISAWCNINFSSTESNPLYYADNLYLNGKLVTDLIIPNNVTKIPAYAFYRCPAISTVTIGNSVTVIGKDAFSGCSGLKEVYIEDISAWCNINFYSYVSNPLYYADNLYLKGKLVTDLIIPNNVTKISAYAFYRCPAISTVTTGNSVTVIGNSAFSDCSGLTSVTIGNSVTTIGFYAFRGCSGLTSVTIGNSVTTIGDSAFYECYNLKYLNYNVKKLVSSNNIFSWCKIKHIVIGKDVETIPDGLFNTDYSSTETIISLNPTPPVCEGNPFPYINKTKCILYVPSANYVDYWSADVWKEFSNIKTLTQAKTMSIDVEDVTINTNEDIQLNAAITPADVSIKDLLWTSSNSAVATVTNGGKVHGVAPGEAIIKAMTIDGTELTASCKVTVGSVKAESITLSQTEAVLAPYESIVLTYTILPASTTDKSVTWSTSNPAVAALRVNDNGSATILLLKDGVAEITATTNDGSNLSASCTISGSSDVEDIVMGDASIMVENGAVVVKNAAGGVTVYNLTGVVVATAQPDGNEVRIDGLQPGVYIVSANGRTSKVVL